MNEIALNRQRAQLLTQARTMLNDEYQQKRSSQYTKWQSESNHLWISKGIMLPYPSSFGYPTEEEVVTKALELYNTQNNTGPAKTTAPSAVDESLTASVTAKLMEVSQSIKPLVLPEIPAISPWQQYSMPEPAVVIEAAVKEIEPIPEPEIEEVEVIEDVEVKEELEPELTEDEKQAEERSNSRLRSLLAQFITMAKGLDAKAQKDEGTA